MENKIVKLYLKSYEVWLVKTIFIMFLNNEIEDRASTYRCPKRRYKKTPIQGL
jgi:hypothetical protein